MHDDSETCMVESTRGSLLGSHLFLVLKCPSPFERKDIRVGLPQKSSFLITYLLTYLLAYLPTYLLTYSTQQSLSWEANRFAASQEIPHILWNPNVHHHTHKCPPPVPILSQIDTVHTPHIPLSGQMISPSPRLSLWIVRNMIRFYAEKLLAPRPTPKLEDHPLSAVRDCSFNILAATLHIGGRSSIRNLRTRHAVVTGTHLSLGVCKYLK